MAWSIEQIRHNASILYNHLCSDDANRVYVDTDGQFQLDTRGWFKRLFTSLGDSSMESIDKVAIRTLRRVLNALESGTLDAEQVIIQERVPIGMFMDESTAEGTIEDLKTYATHPEEPLISHHRAPPNRKWITREIFGLNISNASRFITWMRHPPVPDSQLNYKELLCRKVKILTNQIIHGKALCQRSGAGTYYDVSDDES